MRWLQFENPRKEIRRLGKIMKASPHDPKAYYELGTVYEFLDDRPMAVFFCNKAIQLDPSNITYHAFRAFCNSYLCEHKQLINDLITIIELGGDVSDYYVDMARGTLGSMDREYILRKIASLRKKGKDLVAGKLEEWLGKPLSENVHKEGELHGRSGN
jgi:tetratricopeptide (TPR) repeat protein